MWWRRRRRGGAVASWAVDCGNRATGCGRCGCGIMDPGHSAPWRDATTSLGYVRTHERSRARTEREDDVLARAVAAVLSLYGLVLRPSSHGLRARCRLPRAPASSANPIRGPAGARLSPVTSAMPAAAYRRLSGARAPPRTRPAAEAWPARTATDLSWPGEAAAPIPRPPARPLPRAVHRPRDAHRGSAAAHAPSRSLSGPDSHDLLASRRPAAALSLAAAPALAHAVLAITQASPNQTYRGVVQIGHGCDGRATSPSPSRSPRA